MAFQQEPTRTPVSIGNLVVILKDTWDEVGQPYQSAHFDIRVELSDGSEVVRRGDLVPHITQQQRQALMDFMAALRLQAMGEVLGT